MIRIVHVTDFHLNTKTLKDWNNYVKVAFIDKLKDLNDNIPIDFIAFTGDLLDMGGESFGGLQKGFVQFKSQVIEPILKELELPIERFLIVPGNHDVDRKADKKRIELGIKEAFNQDYNEILNFVETAIQDESFEGIQRIEEYKKFEDSLYVGIPNRLRNIFSTTFQYNLDGKKIGISCINSSWRCYEKDDKGFLVIGEPQLLKSFNFVSRCDYKILLTHHPLDWLLDSEKGIITNHITKDFDLLLLGHVHHNSSSMQTGFNGTLFINIAPSALNDIRSDSKKYANGFAIIDVDHSHKDIECEYYKYNHDSKAFNLNTDVVSEGKSLFKLPSKRTNKLEDLEKNVLANIETEHFKRMDEHIIGIKAQVFNSSIKEAFVLPPINQRNSYQEKEVEIDLTLNDIIKTNQNIIFFGNQESGKTTLLYRIVRELVDEFEFVKKIPVYIDYSEIGHKEYLTVLKEYLGCTSEEGRKLLKENRIVLLIDNLRYKKDGNYIDLTNRLHRFLDEHNDIRVIATSEDEISGNLPIDYIELCEIPFKNYFIRSLRTKEIKCIMRQWLPDEDLQKSEDRLERLVSTFKSYTLPSSAMSVSLFLWSMENKDKKPVNNAVLMEIYIEIILDKLSENNVYRETFDFTNKVQLLAKVAQEMLDNGDSSCSLLYSDFVSTIEKYIKKSTGFEFETSVIVEYFIQRKICIKLHGNRIKFAYSCFFHFFLAKRMEYNPPFREFVLSEDNYHRFNKEIDYYTGLVRSDKVVLETIYERFLTKFKETDYILEIIDLDKHFTFHNKPFESVSKKINIAQIKGSRPSEENIEKHYDRLLKEIPDPTKILRREDSLNLELLLIIMSNVLRNSEGVENRQLKKDAYFSLVKYAMIWMVLYREFLVNFLSKHQKLPSTYPIDTNIDWIIKNLPVTVQMGMYKHLGTPKLGTIILDKIKEDFRNNNFTKSDMETFISVGLYADIQGKDFPKYLKLLVKRVKNNRVRDFLFFKLLHYYYFRTKPNTDQEKLYLDLLSDLRIKSLKLTASVKETIIKKLQDGKKAFKEII